MSFIQFLLMMSMRHSLCPCEWMIGSKVSWIYNFHFSGCDFHFQDVIFYFQAVMGVFLLELKRGDRVAAEKVNWSFIPSELALFLFWPFSLLYLFLYFNFTFATKNFRPWSLLIFPSPYIQTDVSLPQDQEQEAQNQFQLKKVTLFHFSLQKSGQRVGQQERKLQNQDIVSFFSQKKVVTECGGYLQNGIYKIKSKILL